MKRFRVLVASLLVITWLALAAGCLRVAEQRITTHHDQAADTLHVLINYDGLYDSGGNDYGDAEQQLKQGLANGEAFLIDWPFHYQPTELKRYVENEQHNEPWEKSLAAFGKTVLKSVKVETLGHYTDTQNRIGGAQLITAKNVKTLIAEANKAIDAGLLAVDDAPPSEFARSWQRIRKAAENGHAWLGLDGHAITVTIPVEPREWAYLKARALSDLPAEATRNRANYLKFVKALAGLATSYQERDGIMKLTLGDPKHAPTFRVHVSNNYKDNFAKAVKTHVKTNLDAALADALIAGNAEAASDGVAALLKWGPAEDKARALLAAMRGNDADRAAQAADALAKFGRTWNREAGLPAAPTVGPDAPGFSDEWTAWCEKMMRYPMIVDIPDQN